MTDRTGFVVNRERAIVLYRLTLGTLAHQSLLSLLPTTIGIEIVYMYMRSHIFVYPQRSVTFLELTLFKQKEKKKLSLSRATADTYPVVPTSRKATRKKIKNYS